jgi:hypothetical protein
MLLPQMCSVQDSRRRIFVTAKEIAQEIPTFVLAMKQRLVVQMLRLWSFVLANPGRIIAIVPETVLKSRNGANVQMQKNVAETLHPPFRPLRWVQFSVPVKVATFSAPDTPRKIIATATETALKSRNGANAQMQKNAAVKVATFSAQDNPRRISATATETAPRSRNGANVQMQKNAAETLHPPLCPLQLIQFSVSAKVIVSFAQDSCRRTFAIAMEIAQEILTFVHVMKQRHVVQTLHL